MGDTACDLGFGKFICPKTYGGHCLRFVIWGTFLSQNLRGTLLAICGLGSLFIKKLKGDTACDL